MGLTRRLMSSRRQPRKPLCRSPIRLRSISRLRHRLRLRRSSLMRALSCTTKFRLRDHVFFSGSQQNETHPVFSMMSPLIRPLRSLANGLGVAWWARVETSGPDVTYWFGPFVTRRGLEKELPVFLEDVSSEDPQDQPG